MPVRRTKRGAARTPLSVKADVLVCGASFAGLAVARELAGARAGHRPARVMVVDRYEVGERQTSACAAPPSGCRPSASKTRSARPSESWWCTRLIAARYRLPWTFSTFDYRTLCDLLLAQCDIEFETATVEGRTGLTVHTDRGDLNAPLVVDCLGWRRVLGDGPQPPDAPLSRGLEVHPGGSGQDLEIWIDRSYVPAGYGWSFPARDELRIGLGSFDPRFHVKDSTVRLAEDLGRDATGYQGNWIPHRLGDPTEGHIFFCGDSAGHCLPLTAEGIRTAFYFGIACARELRAVLEGSSTRGQALRRYAAFSASHERKYAWLLRLQRFVPHVPSRLLGAAVATMDRERFLDWSFGHYGRITPASFASTGGPETALIDRAAA